MNKLFLCTCFFTKLSTEYSARFTNTFATCTQIRSSTFTVARIYEIQNNKLNSHMYILQKFYHSHLQSFVYEKKNNTRCQCWKKLSVLLIHNDIFNLQVYTFFGPLCMYILYLPRHCVKLSGDQSSCMHSNLWCSVELIVDPSKW